MKILVVFGTRPEAIKMCPLVLELKKRDNMDCVVCLTGQHKGILRQVMDVFQIQEDYNLDIMKESQSITSITIAVLEKLEKILEKEQPSLVLVHGDTTTSFVAALAAFYQRIPVGHVEAGLRTGNKYSPYPEEMNRCLTARIADFHFAPTDYNMKNLKKEGITNGVYVTGNTVIDSFQYTILQGYQFNNEMLKKISWNDDLKIVLLTAHRRENWGIPLVNIFCAVKRIACEHDECLFIYPVHPNPVVRNSAEKVLGGIDNIMLIDPLDVLDMHNLMRKCYMVMTDSGGLQEEAPALGKPVLVLRTETERSEAAEAGTVEVVGTDEEVIYRKAVELLTSKERYEQMANAVNPYGDGQASRKIADIIEKLKEEEIIR